MADAAKSRDGAAAVGLFQKGLEPAFGLDDVDFRVGGAVFPDSDAGGVIAPVFQLFQPPQQDGGCLFFTDVKYSLQGTTQGRYLTGGVPPVRFSM